MDSEEELVYDESEEEMSDNAEEDDDDDDHMIVMEPEVSSTTYESQDEAYPHQVLKPEDILQHMVECIRDVNTIVEVSFANEWPPNGHEYIFFSRLKLNTYY